MNYLSICMNFKDEAPYLKEWLDFHLIVGVEHFYLFDNNSSDNFLEILKPYREKKLVTLHSVKDNPAKPKVYEHVLKNYSEKNSWIGFLDCDEFLCPTIEDDIKNIIKDFEEYPGIGINWKMFGSNNHLKKPKGLVIENYILRQDEKESGWTENHHIKSIVNPKKVFPNFVNPHFFLYNPFFCLPKIPAAVNENYEIIGNNSSDEYIKKLPAFTNEVSYNKLSVNHYWSKSEEEYINRKLSKPMDDNGKQRSSSKEELNNFNLRSNKIKDTTILRFVDKVKNYNV